MRDELVVLVVALVDLQLLVLPTLLARELLARVLVVAQVEAPVAQVQQQSGVQVAAVELTLPVGQPR
jgi:hypothetical protein